MDDSDGKTATGSPSRQPPRARCPSASPSENHRKNVLKQIEALLPLVAQDASGGPSDGRRPWPKQGDKARAALAETRDPARNARVIQAIAAGVPAKEAAEAEGISKRAALAIWGSHCLKLPAIACNYAVLRAAKAGASVIHARVHREARAASLEALKRAAMARRAAAPAGTPMARSAAKEARAAAVRVALPPVEQEKGGGDIPPPPNEAGTEA